MAVHFFAVFKPRTFVYYRKRKRKKARQQHCSSIGQFSAAKNQRYKKKGILVIIKRSDKQARRWESWQQLSQCRGMPLPRGPHRTPVVLCRRIAPPSFISCHSLQVDRRHNCVSRRVFTKPHEPVIRCFSSDGNTVLHTLPYHCSPVPKTF